MSTAFILLNCAMGSEKQVVSDLKKMDCVKNIYEVFGIYDILIKLECDCLEELRQSIIQEIRKTDNVRSTTTLMGRLSMIGSIL